MAKDELQIRSIIVFGDMSGFGSFTQRITHPDSEFRPFIREYDDLIDAFEEKTGYFLKRLGDGVLCVVELHEGTGIVPVVNAVWDLTRQLNRLISKKRTPRPTGFRSRLVCGYVWKTVRSHKREDYLGYHVNLCEKILHVNKEDIFVCHESVKELMPRRSGYTFKRIVHAEAVPEGMYSTDINALWTMTRRE